LNRRFSAAKVAAVTDAAVRHTPLHAQHVALGARMVPFAGWHMPVQYKGITQEHQAVRQAVGLFDVSHMGELFVAGPNARAILDGLITNDLRGLEVGRALYTVACNERGTILDDLIVYRVGAERYLVVCNAGNREKISRHIGEHARRGHAEFSDRSDDTALIALQGPRSPDVLAALGAVADVLSLPRFGVLSTRLAGLELTLARTGYTGEDGYELFVANADAAQLWAALLDAGRSSGIEPIGLGARDTLRLEARLSLYGNEIDDTTNPFEAGLGWTVKLDKGEFLGRAALVELKAKPPLRALVGFELVGRGIARQGYPIVGSAGEALGAVTSGAPSLSLGKNIGLGYVPPTHRAVGSELGIEIRGKRIEAKVVTTPFYKRS
jgi:aminomethyltransferase